MLNKDYYIQSVRDAPNAMDPNKVLLFSPPPVHDFEKNLPRATRATLSQLSSGYSNYLNSYKARINPAIQNLCPQCNAHSHTTRHIFANRTNLTTRDLWNESSESARFLNLATDDPDDHEWVGPGQHK